MSSCELHPRTVFLCWAVYYAVYYVQKVNAKYGLKQIPYIIKENEGHRTKKFSFHENLQFSVNNKGFIYYFTIKKYSCMNLLSLKSFQHFFLMEAGDTMFDFYTPIFDKVMVYNGRL